LTTTTTTIQIAKAITIQTATIATTITTPSATIEIAITTAAITAIATEAPTEVSPMTAAEARLILTT
jgi:hypothetical protein